MKRLCLLFIILLSVVASSCIFYNSQVSEDDSVIFHDEADRQEKMLPNHKIVRVGYFPGGEFMQGESDGERKSGYGYEYLQHIAGVTGWEYEYVYGDWIQLFQKLQDGEIDILAEVSYTDERSNTILFPNDIMGTQNYFIFVKENDDRFDSENLNTLNGAKIGVNAGTYQEKVLKEWVAQNNLSIEIVPYFKELHECYRDLYTGKVDAMVELDQHGRLSSVQALAKIGSSDYYLAVSKSRPDLLDDINKAQKHTQEIMPGFIQRLQYKYYGDNMVSLRFSKAEKEWINNHQVLRVGYILDYMPYSDSEISTDTDLSQARGATIELLNRIKHRLGLDDMKIEFVPIKSYKDMKQASEDGRIDLIAPIYADIWQAEQHGYFNTSSFNTINIVMICPKDIARGNIKTVAVTLNDPLVAYYEEFFSRDVYLKYFKDNYDCIRAVAAGQADCTYMNAYKASKLMKYSEYGSKLVSVDVEIAEVGFAVVRKDMALLSLLNRGLSLIPREEINDIMANYASDTLSYTEKDFIMDNWRIGMLVVMVFLLVLFALYWGNRSRQRVTMANDIIREKQLQLEEALREAEERAENENALNEQLTNLNAELKKNYDGQQSANEKLVKLNKSLDKARNEYKEQLAVINGLGKEYHTLCLIRKSNRTVKLYRFNNTTIGILLKMARDEARYDVLRQFYISKFVAIDDQVMMMQSTDLEVIHRETEGDVPYIVNYHRVDADGNISYHQLTYARAISEDGEEGYVLGFRDIDQTIKREKFLADALAMAQRANEAKTIFLNNMSHDIRTPMNAIIGFTDMMEKNIDNRERVLEYIAKLKSSNSYLLDLINNVLEMSRIESGKVVLDESVQSLPDMLEALSIIFEDLLKNKNLEYISDISIRHELVYIDSTKFKEVLLNILSNAVKYTNEGGRISLSIREENSTGSDKAHFNIIVEDTGIGMSEEFLPHLYDSFEREHNSTESKIMGTGLGMAITKKLIELMGGTIAVESEVGKGSRFMINLSMKIADTDNLKEAPGNIEKTDEEISLKGMRALLAEDNDINVEIITYLLDEAGLLTERAADGAQCLEMLEKAEDGYYDFILMDILMPNMNGYECARAIRKLENKSKSRIPIIAMTANAFDEDKRQALEAGMDDHVAKPVDVKKLFKSIEAVLSKRKRSLQL